MHTISLCGAKGGSLKTAACLSLSSLLTARGLDVALVDLDPQHSCTLSLPMRVPWPGELEEAHAGVTDPLSSAPVEVTLPEWPEGHGRMTLRRGGRGLVTASRREIHRHLERIQADVVIVDTMPTLADSVIAAMERSDLIIVPTEATSDALRALPGMLESAREVSGDGAIIRILLTKVDVRERITADARRLLSREYPGFLYQTAIPIDVRAKEASWYLRPVVDYDFRCRAAGAYKRLLGEVIADLRLDKPFTSVADVAA